MDGSWGRSWPQLQLICEAWVVLFSLNSTILVLLSDSSSSDLAVLPTLHTAEWFNIQQVTEIRVFEVVNGYESFSGCPAWHLDLILQKHLEFSLAWKQMRHRSYAALAKQNKKQPNSPSILSLASKHHSKQNQWSLPKFCSQLLCALFFICKTRLFQRI